MKKIIIILFCISLFVLPTSVWAADCANSDYTCAEIEALLDMVNAGYADRDISTLSFTNGASQTTFTEANMLANSAINNQGAGEETDVILVAVSYPIKFAVETSEAFQIELCPPAGEIFTHDGTALDANDCILSSATVGSSFVVKRMQIADASWQYFTYTVQGVNTDGGAGD